MGKEWREGGRWRGGLGACVKEQHEEDSMREGEGVKGTLYVKEKA